EGPAQRVPGLLAVGRGPQGEPPGMEGDGEVQPQGRYDYREGVLSTPPVDRPASQPRGIQRRHPSAVPEVRQQEGGPQGPAHHTDRAVPPLPLQLMRRLEPHPTHTHSARTTAESTGELICESSLT